MEAAALVRRRRGFTLVEMLVFIAIMGVLAGLLFPALSRARASSRQTSCKSNLRQTGLALSMYEGVWSLYPCSTLGKGLSRHLADPKVMRRPSDPVSTREDTYSLFYGRGRPKLLGENTEIVMCPNHRGNAFGVFADGRVADIPRLAGAENLHLKAYVGGKTGMKADLPYHVGATTDLWFLHRSIWHQITMTDATLANIYGSGSLCHLSGGADPDSPNGQLLHMSTLPYAASVVNYDVSGPSARLLGEKGFPVVRVNETVKTFKNVEVYSCHDAANLEGLKKYSMLLHTRPQKFQDGPAQARNPWPEWPNGYAEARSLAIVEPQVVTNLTGTASHMGWLIYQPQGIVRDLYHKLPNIGWYGTP